jgi:co-chaperonin GroES (HSP10)
MNMNEPVASNEAELAWAFPSVNPGAEPLGARILVQLRRTKKKATSAGIILVEETKETEKWNNMVAKVMGSAGAGVKMKKTQPCS